MRGSLSALGKHIGLSQPAISERVVKLQEAGIITGYGARIDPTKLGLRLQAIVRLRTTHAHIQRCIELFESLPEVVEVFRITGEDCFVIRCLIAVPEDLEHVVNWLPHTGASQPRWCSRIQSRRACPSDESARPDAGCRVAKSAASLTPPPTPRTMPPLPPGPPPSSQPHRKAG